MSAGNQILIMTLLLIVSVATAFAEESPRDLTRTPGGHPDMQGVWFFGSKTPHQRPIELGNKRYYTESEALALERSAEKTKEMRGAPQEFTRGAPPAGAEIGQAADGQSEVTRTRLAKISGEYRTSLIVDPADGRLPYRVHAMDIFDQWRVKGFGEFDGPEMRPPTERCVNGIGQMPPMIGWRYNANMQIVQTPGYVVIAGETHPARIIPITNEHQAHGFTYWMGDSIAKWEGDTLVIHTDHFNPSASFGELKSSGELQVTERLSLVADDELFYQYTMTDPPIYTRTFTVEMSIIRRPAGELMYEWGCHEGNYSLSGILAGARAQEMDRQ